MKEKFKSYSFWMSVTASVILVLNNIGDVLGFSVQNEVVTRIVDSICGVLILFGILTMPKSSEGEEQSNSKDIKQEEIISQQTLESGVEISENQEQNKQDTSINNKK